MSESVHLSWIICLAIVFAVLMAMIIVTYRQMRKRPFRPIDSTESHREYLESIREEYGSRFANVLLRQIVLVLIIAAVLLLIYSRIPWNESLMIPTCIVVALALVVIRFRARFVGSKYWGPYDDE